MRFVAAQTWPAIRRMAKDKGRHWVAVPYVSPGAFNRLRLRRGDVLITNFDDDAIKAGQTDPREILRYIRAGVEVHNEPALHGKVYVSTKRAVICSANVSTRSELGLLEAGLELVQRKAMADARRFVQELRGAVIGLEHARKKIRLFRSGKWGLGNKRVPMPASPRTSHQLWIVSLVTQKSTEQERAAARRVKKKAESKIEDRVSFRVDEFLWSGTFAAHEGDYVLQVVRDGRSVYVEAPAQIVVIEEFANRRGKGISVALEARKRVRTRSLAQMDVSVRSSAGIRFPRVAKCRKVANRALRRAILAEWPTVEELNAAR